MRGKCFFAPTSTVLIQGIESAIGVERAPLNGKTGVMAGQIRSLRESSSNYNPQGTVKTRNFLLYLARMRGKCFFAPFFGPFLRALTLNLNRGNNLLPPANQSCASTPFSLARIMAQRGNSVSGGAGGVSFNITRACSSQVRKNTPRFSHSAARISNAA